MIGNVVNFVVFQAAWFTCILGAASGRPWLGVIVVAASAVGHVAFARHRAGTALLLAASAVLGYAADSALVVAGWMSFPEPTRLGSPATLWMVALWISFATTLHRSLAWLGRRYVVGAVLGLVAGPLTYYAGMRFGAVELTAPLAASLGAVGLEWLVSMPLLMWIARRTDRAPAPRPRNGNAVPEGAAGSATP